MTLGPIRFSLAVALLISTLGASAAHAQVFLKIDGIQGEASDAAHKDEIVVDSYAFGAELAVSMGGAAGGAGIGKATFDRLQFKHSLDRASTALMLALAKGQHVKSAVLSVRRAGAPGDYLKITLTDVLVTSVKVSGSAREVPDEEVALTFAKIQVEYSATQRDGKLVAGGKMSWDVVKNTGG